MINLTTTLFHVLPKYFLNIYEGKRIIKNLPIILGGILTFKKQFDENCLDKYINFTLLAIFHLNGFQNSLNGAYLFKFQGLYNLLI